MLAPELERSLPAAQNLPEQDLGKPHVPAQGTGGDRFGTQHLRRAPSTALRAVPLPVLGRTCNRAGKAHDSSLAFTTAPSLVSRTASPISASSTGRPASLSQKADRKL